MKLAIVQHDILWEDPDGNRTAVAPRLELAARAGVDLVLFPEMWSCGFSMNTAAIAEPYAGPTATWMQDRARELGLWIGGSVPELPEAASTTASEQRPFNTFIVAGPEGQIHRYRKLHPFTYAGEHEHYRAGTELVTVTIAGARCSLFICYDLRFADAFWSLAPASDCYLVVANWPRARREHWTTLLRARAIENQAYVVGVNRVGHGGKLDYAGDSCVIDPLGTVLLSAQERATMLIGEVDPEIVANTRSRFPFLRDRRG